MRFTILSCSLDAQSKGFRLAELAGKAVEAAGHDQTLVDLRTIDLPPFDNGRAFDHPSYAHLHDAIAGADGVFIAAPVYNWGLGGALKTLIELTGATGEGARRSAWFDKAVTFLCSGGLPHSYMAYGSTALSLMLDFKCVLNPYMVYATDRDWTAGEPGAALSARLFKTVEVMIELTDVLRQRRYRSDWDV